MGCDIHGVIESERKSPDGYEYFASEFILGEGAPRDYEWFSLLADMRSGGLDAMLENKASIKAHRSFIRSARIQPRGIPDHMSYEYMALVSHWGTDGHTHSWVTTDELRTINGAYSLAMGYRLGYMQTILRIMDTLEEFDRSIKCRVVFFFDN